MKGIRLGIGTLLAVASFPMAAAIGGEFDRIEAERLAALVSGPDAKTHDHLSIGALEALPRVLRDTPSAFLVVKTDQGNYCRVLAVPALRKPARGNGDPVPILLLERFDTFEPGKASSRLARGAGLMLFDGFEVDLDSGQVVPVGQGGDLAFESGRNGDPALHVREPAKMYSLTKPLPPEPAAPGPSPGKAVLATDFAGRYNLFADGRFAGLIELQVNEDRLVSGRYRSDANGTSHPIAGEVAAEPANKFVFTIKLPRIAQEYSGFLASDGKAVIAGSFTMLGKEYGFFAIREGTRIEPAP